VGGKKERNYKEEREKALKKDGTKDRQTDKGRRKKGNNKTTK